MKSYQGSFILPTRILVKSSTQDRQRLVIQFAGDTPLGRLKFTALSGRSFGELCLGVGKEEERVDPIPARLHPRRFRPGSGEGNPASDCTR